MGEMKGEQKQADNVKGRDVNVLESVNHHRINVVMIERIIFQHWKTGVEFPAGKMKEMKNDESEDDQSAHHHVARSVTCLDVIPFLIALRAGTPVIERQTDRKIKGEKNCNQQRSAHRPKEGAGSAQMLRVVVEPTVHKKNL